MKMFFGLVMMSASMGLMTFAANQENRRSAIVFNPSDLPAGIVVNADGKLAPREHPDEPFHAGRLFVDPAKKMLILDGVLDENERDRLIKATAPEDFRKKVKELQEKSAQIDGAEVASAEVTLEQVPPAST